jgi:acetolactate synthase regulatory subunit
VKDCNYSELKDLFVNDPEIIKYPFLLDAWIGDSGRVEYGLLQDAPTTDRVLRVMAERGYRCSIVERLRAAPDEALLRQALEALESADWYIDQLEQIVYDVDDTGTHEERAKVQSAITAIKERLGEPHD